MDRDVSAQAVAEGARELIHKDESEAATRVFESPDIYNLPVCNTHWQLSNAISWITDKGRGKTARTYEDSRRGLAKSSMRGGVDANNRLRPTI